MELNPQQIFSFQLRSNLLRVLWRLDQDVDEEQFSVIIHEKNVGYGLTGGVESFISTLPVSDSLVETRLLMHQAVTKAKAGGWRVTTAPYDSVDEW